MIKKFLVLLGIIVLTSITFFGCLKTNNKEANTTISSIDSTTSNAYEIENSLLNIVLNSEIIV